MGRQSFKLAPCSIQSRLVILNLEHGRSQRAMSRVETITAWGSMGRRRFFGAACWYLSQGAFSYPRHPG